MSHGRWTGSREGSTYRVRLEPQEDAESLANLIRWEIIERVRTGEWKA